MEIMTIESNAYRLLVEKIEKITAYVEESRNREETERKRKEEAESPVTKGRKADPKWMTHKEVCEALDISHRTLQRYRQKNIVPYSMIGRQIYPRQAVESLRERWMVETPAAKIDRMIAEHPLHNRKTEAMVRKEEVLARTSNGLDVFRHYLPVKWRVGRNFLNPLYADSKASCNVYYDRRSGTYRMKDFGNGDYSGDCFFLVAKLKGLDCRNAADFVEVLHTIDRELCLGLDGDSPTDGTVGTGAVGDCGSCRAQGAAVPGKPERTRKRRLCPPTVPNRSPTGRRRSPSPRGACLLGRIGHHRGGAAPLRDGIARRVPGRDEGGQGVRLQFHPGGTDVRVQGKWGVKVYRPMSEVRFVYGGHTGDNYCFGLEQLPSKGDLLFLTGGEKDVLTLAAHGFHAICFNSETSVIPAKTVRKLVYRFKHIVLLYDTDKTGLECSEKHRAQLAEYGVKRLVLPLSGTKAEKDVTDYFKAGHTREELMGLFLKLLDTLYGDTLAMLKSCEIDYDHPPEQAVAIVTAGDVPLGSENILITGGEGTGKSNYTAALVAGAIMERETDADLLGCGWNRTARGVRCCSTTRNRASNSSTRTRAAAARAGRERMPEYLHVYCLTGMSRSERLTAIVQSMDRYYYLHGASIWSSSTGGGPDPLRQRRGGERGAD